MVKRVAGLALLVALFAMGLTACGSPSDKQACVKVSLNRTTFRWELDANLPEYRGISTYLYLNNKEQRPPVDGQAGHYSLMRKPDTVEMRVVGWQEAYGSGGLKSLPGGEDTSAKMCADIKGGKVTKVTTTYYGVDPRKEVFFNKLTINGKYFEDPQGRYRAGSPTKTYTPDIPKGVLDWEVKELGGRPLADVAVNLNLIR